MHTKVEIFEDEAGEYRWRVVAGNSRIIAVSGEGFTREHDAVRAFVQSTEHMSIALDNWRRLI